MKKLLLALALLLAPTISWAQCSGQFPNNTVCGNVSGVNNFPRSVPLGSVITSTLGIKTPVDLATTANITLSGEQTIDGVLTSGSRVLVKDQSTASENGIYVSAAGAWSRATDFNASGQVVQGTQVYATGGTANIFGTFTVTAANPITIGSTDVTFTGVSSAGATTLNAISRYSNLTGGTENSGVTLSDTNIASGLAGIGTKITLDASGNFTRLQTDLTSSDYSVWGGNAPWYFAVSDSWSPGNGSFAVPFLVQDTMTGGNGSRQAFAGHFSTTGTAGVAGEFYQGGDFVGENNGTGSGNYFGIGVYGIARSGAATTTEIVSGEFDTLSEVAVIQRKIGVQIVDLAGSVGSATAGLDAGLWISSQVGAVGYTRAIEVIDAGIKTGGSAFVSPGTDIKKSGAIVLSGSGDYGIDFNTGTYTKPIRLKNNTPLVFRNAGDTADVDALALNSLGDAVLFGTNFSGSIFTNGTLAPITAAGANLGGASNGWANLFLGGSTSGSLQLKTAAVSGTSVLTFPAGTTDFSATGGASQVVKQTSAGGALTVGQLANTDITGLGTASVKNTGTSGDAVPLLNVSNTFGDSQTISKSAAADHVKLTITNTADGYSGLEMFGNGVSWLMSKRLAGDSNILAWYYNNGGYTLQMALSTAGTLSLAGGVTVGSTTLLTSSVALANGAAAATGTLANAPAAGNPTKWIPINDNGTTRYIPAW